VLFGIATGGRQLPGLPVLQAALVSAAPAGWTSFASAVAASCGAAKALARVNAAIAAGNVSANCFMLFS